MHNEEKLILDSVGNCYTREVFVGSLKEIRGASLEHQMCSTQAYTCKKKSEVQQVDPCRVHSHLFGWVLTGCDLCPAECSHSLFDLVPGGGGVDRVPRGFLHVAPCQSKRDASLDYNMFLT